jgi:hypothetical protein
MKLYFKSNIKIIVYLFSILCWGNSLVNAQAPYSFNFQGIALDSAGFIVANKPLGIRFSISSDSLGAITMYQEIINTNTDRFGQFSAAIGSGIIVSGKLEKIIWSSGKAYLKTELDINKTGKYKSTGIAKLLSVPYAFYANKAAEASFVELMDVQNNLKIGANSLSKNKTGSNNIAIGRNALYTLDSNSNNIAIGSNALQKSINKGEANLAIGQQSLLNNTIGEGNIAIGNLAMVNNVSGGGNIGIGYYALTAGTTGIGNVAMGRYALTKNTIGSLNTAIGEEAIANNTTGNENTALGRFSLWNSTTGTHNLALGSHALLNLKSGTGNTVIGTSAGRGIINGSRNVVIGFTAAYDSSKYKEINDKLIIGNSSNAEPLIYGEFDHKKVNINGDLYVNNKKIIHYDSIILALSMRIDSLTSSLSPVQLNKNLLAYYPLNGNVGDSSGNNFHGTSFQLSYTNDRLLNSNHAVSFNGTDGYIGLPLITGMNNKSQLSINFLLNSEFVFPKANASVITLFYNGNTQISLSADTKKLGVTINNVNHLSTTTIPVSKWSQISILYNGNNTIKKNRLALYIDGELKEYFGNDLTPDNTGNSTITSMNAIGAYTGKYYFKGLIDEVRIYDRLLQLSEISFLMNH